MKRSFIRSFSIDADVGEAFKLAQERLRMTGSEIVNRLMLEWLTSAKPRSLAPTCPIALEDLPPELIQRAKDLAAKERGIRRA